MRLICGSYKRNTRRSFTVSWLADSTEDASIRIQEKIRSIFHHMKTFHTDEDCEEYFRRAPLTETIVLIASAELAKNVVHCLHPKCQLAIMFVFDTSEEVDNQWICNCRKVKLVKLEMLEKHVRSFWHRWLRNSSNEFLSNNIFNIEKIGAQQSATEMNGTFLYLQLFSDILIRIKPLPTDKDKFVRMCAKLCDNSVNQTEILKDFNSNYQANDVIEWYTKDSFIYRYINHALRIHNIDFLIHSRFLIRDLQNQIKQHQCDHPVRVYRAQLMSTNELSKMTQSIGQYLSMHSFLSTSLSRDIALGFLGVSETDVSRPQDGLEYVLFEIDADPNLSGEVPGFANIADFSGFDEEEILFASGSVFQLLEVHGDPENQYLTIVSMALCGNDEHPLKSVCEFMKKEYEEYGSVTTNTDEKELLLSSLGNVLLNLGYFDTAEQIFRCVLSTLKNTLTSKDEAKYYRYMGDVCRQKNKFKTSRKWYQKALAIYALECPNNDNALVATTYLCLGHAYNETTDWKFSIWYQSDFANWWATRHSKRWRKSLGSYSKALEIYKRIYDEEHPCAEMATCYLGLGSAYLNTRNYELAIDNCQKALHIEEKVFPPLHPNLPYCHNKLALSYLRNGQIDLARTHSEKALEMGLNSLPDDHPLIIELYYVLGTIYHEMGDLTRRDECFKKQIDILNLPRTSVLTTLDVVKISGSRMYYICPQCHLSVWVYAVCRMYKGRRCARCLRQMLYFQRQTRKAPV